MSDAPNRQAHQIRWAVITKMGRVVVEAETADAAREKVERRGISSSKSIVTTVAKRCRSRLRARTQSATSLRPQKEPRDGCRRSIKDVRKKPPLARTA